MIVSCPNCSTRYVLDATVLRPPGRHVRCARCQTTWFQEPALDLGAEAMIPETAREPVSDKSRMLPAPPRIGAQAEREVPDMGGYRDRQRDLARDLDRDLPRETGRDGHRDPLRDPPQRDVVREALGHDSNYGSQPVTREISRDVVRDMGRELDRRDHSQDRRFEPAPVIRSGDIAFDEPVRSDPSTERRRVSDDRRRGEERKKGGMSGLLIGGGMFLSLLAGVAFVADSMHAQIVEVFPGTRGIFSMLGYAPAQRGLDFANITHGKEIENGVTVLAIRGQIVNVTDHEVAVPKMRVTVSDSEKQKLYQWTVPPEQTKIGPKSKIPLSIRLESPPPEAWYLDIRFAKAGE